MLSVKKRITESDMCFSNSVQQDVPASKSSCHLISKVTNYYNIPILPGLPDDVSKYCFAFIPRSNFLSMGAVCKRWRSFIKRKEFTVRKLAGTLEESLYVLTPDAEGTDNHCDVLDCFGHKHHQLPPVPGPFKADFGVVVLNGKLLVIAGYSAVDGTGSVHFCYPKNISLVQDEPIKSENGFAKHRWKRNHTWSDTLDTQIVG